MYYLFFQIWVWLLISFIFGWVAHWFLLCRGRDQHHEHAQQVAPVNQPTPTTPAPTAKAEPPEVEKISDDWKPTFFTAAPEKVDDIKRIKGIGAVIEKTLNELGVYQFEQIASWDEKNCKWVDDFLAFPGRITREDWVNQAKLLASGGTTEFAKRVDKGDVSYKS